MFRKYILNEILDYIEDYIVYNKEDNKDNVILVIGNNGHYWDYELSNGMLIGFECVINDLLNLLNSKYNAYINHNDCSTRTLIELVIKL